MGSHTYGSYSRRDVEGVEACFDHVRTCVGTRSNSTKPLRKHCDRAYVNLCHVTFV